MLTGAHEGIAVVTLNRPGSKNALGKAMMNEFRATLDRLRFDPSVRVVILKSSVPKVFCAGADLKERAEMTKPEVAAFVYGLRTSFSSLSSLPMPTIAVIEGAALGGGLELAMACDFRIAGEGSLLGLPETGLAIIPGAGGTQRLPRLVGLSKAKELTFTGRKINPMEGERIGLITKATEAGKAYESAIALAAEILPNGPVAVRMAKEAIDKGIEVDISSGMTIEQACYAQVIPTTDRLEGLKAFREKRKPVYKGE